ncbi:MAG: DeoR family transcriptional regulator [Patescibacteria group bacterium]
MRELADDILTKPQEGNFAVLDAFFEVVKAQNWVSLQDVLVIQAEYANIRGAQKEVYPKERNIEVQSLPTSTKNLLERQEKILAILREKGKAQVWEMKQIFPQISKRTLRRDCEYLLKQGVIERLGERNNTFYQVKLG